MVNWTFSRCVDFLEWSADKVGMPYEAINVWIFCVIWPVITVTLAVMVVRQAIVIRSLNAAR